MKLIVFSPIAPLQDPAGHLYSARDICIRFSEPRPEPTSSEVTEELLSHTVRWSERGSDLATPPSGVLKPTGPLLSVGDLKAPGNNNNNNNNYILYFIFNFF